MSGAARRALIFSAALGLVLFLALGLGCGKKGDPVPPAPRASAAPPPPEEPTAEAATPGVKAEQRKRKKDLLPP